MPVPKLAFGQTSVNAAQIKTDEPKPLIDLPALAKNVFDPVTYKTLDDFLTRDFSTPVRAEIDKYVPDLDLRASRLEKSIIAERGSGVPLLQFGQRSAGTAEDQAKAMVLSDVQSGKITPNFLAGFVASATSSLPEFFGMPAPVESEVFRIQNPWLGLVSEVIGPGGAYFAAFKISKVGKLATATEALTTRSLGFFGKTAKSNPVVAAGLKEFWRYTPLELSRLGVGATVWPDNMDDLGTAVAVGMGLNFALGGAGGWLRQFGNKAKATKAQSLLKNDIGIMPTFELRNIKEAVELQAKNPDIPMFEVGADPSKLILQKTSEVLSARPGRVTKGQPVTMKAEKPFWDLLDIGKEGSSLLGRLFQVNSSKASADAVSKAGLDVRLLLTGGKADASKIPAEMQKKLLASFGFKDTSDLAQNFVFPRMVKVTSARMSGQFAKEFDPATNAGLQWFKDEGVMIAKDGEGLWVVAKRMGSDVTAAAKGKPKGALQHKNGDYWFVAKTDRLDLLLPKQHQSVMGRIADWAKLNSVRRPGRSDDVFNQHMDIIQKSMSDADWAALRNVGRAKGVATIMDRLRKKVTTEMGLSDSRALKGVAEGIYDVMAPTALKETYHPIYQKAYGMLKGVVGRADEITGQIMRGTPFMKGSPMAAIRNADNVGHTPLWNDLESMEQLVHSLDAAELNLIANGSQVAGPDMANTLAQLAESGMLSDRAKDVLRQWQETNKRVIDEFVKPALKAAGIEEPKWLDGYVLPRIYRGDHYIDIKSGNSTVYRVSAATPAETQRIAGDIIAEASARGKSYKTSALQQFNEANEAVTNFEQLLDSVAPIGAGDKEVQDIVLGGMKRARASKPGIPKVSSPGSFKERSSLAVADYEWGAPEVLTALNGHYQQLLRFAAQKTWHKRWYEEFAAWGEAGHEMMLRDVQRKAAQYMGIEGGLAKAINGATKDLLPFVGNHSASKAAGMANSIMYQMMLGFFNTNFAVLNAVTPIMTSLPWMAMMTTASDATRLKYMQVVPDVASPTGMRAALEPLRVFKEGMKITAKPNDLERAMMNRAIGDGTLNPQIYDNFAGGQNSAVGQGIRESFKNGGAWEGFMNISGSAALKSEQFSRLLSFNMSLALGRDFFKLQDEALYRFAKKATEQQMYAYGVTDRARIMTGPAGSLLGLFKNWSFHYMAQMAEYAGLAMKGETMAPALYMLGTSMAIGGIGATPLKSVIDGFVSWNTESPTAFHWLNNNWPDAADGIYFGLPALLGLSLQGSSTMPGTDIVRDMTMLTNIVSLERGKQLAALAGKMGDYGEGTSRGALTNDKLRAEAFGVLTPRSVGRIYATLEDDAVLSLRTGYPIKRDVGPWTKLLYGMGLNQTEVDRYYVAGRELYSQQEKEKVLISSLGMEYADALEEGRQDRMQRVLDKGLMLGLDLGKVVQSAQTRNERFESDALSRYDQIAVEGYVGDR